MGALQGREGNGPGSGGPKERRATRRSGPPAEGLPEAAGARGSSGPPGGPQGPLRHPRASAGIPRAPGEPPKTRALSSLPSPLPFPSLLFPFPPPVPGGPQDWVGGGDRTPPRGGLSPV